MTQAVVVLAAALGSSALTGLASLGVTWFRDWRQGKGDDKAALHAAIMEILSRSMAVASRAQAMGQMMKVRSGLIEGLDIALHHRKPVDALELHDWLAQDVVPLNAALGEIWTRWDQEGVRLANDVVGKSMEVVGASTALQPTRGAGERVRAWAMGERWTPGMRKANDRAVRDLAHARKRLADYARTKLGNDAVNLFAQVAEEQEPKIQSPAIPTQPEQGAPVLPATELAPASANGRSQPAG